MFKVNHSGIFIVNFEQVNAGWDAFNGVLEANLLLDKHFHSCRIRMMHLI